MTDEELSLPWQQKIGICLLCCVCISLQVSSRLSVLLAGNVNIGMKTIDCDLFELGRHTVMLMTSDAMLHIYRIAGNFRGVQFSWKGKLQAFRGLIFANGRSRTAPPTIPG